MKFAAAVAVQSSVGSNPQDSVRCLHDVVCLAAVQPVVAAIHRLDVGVVGFLLLLLIPHIRRKGRIRRNRNRTVQKQHCCQKKASDTLALFPAGSLFSTKRPYNLDVTI